eukprot:TRINITY_DN6770_c0_g1_i1.p1 TRINITY_DN6770_c0_g1~~TRINITY_DN6770_c0_g1_i1.p1  ORF type:complete len:250 (-),score=55.84 TRINITY_DN6770_c0_g1_i1:121-819(-)
MDSGIKYINQEEAKQIDSLLMSDSLGFNNDILMELAGLSCAQAILESYPPTNTNTAPSRVLVIVGPGNNGGDGMVCARHLSHFGYDVSCCYPREKEIHPFGGLKKQCIQLNIPFSKTLDDLSKYNIVVDAIFGYSFTGEIRAPFDTIIENLKQTKTPIISIDIPSGWHVEKGNINNTFEPQCLISLTAPKLGVKSFKGIHYLGGRFVPPGVASKFDLRLPSFPGGSQHVRLS